MVPRAGASRRTLRRQLRSDPITVSRKRLAARVHGRRPPYHCADTAVAALLEGLRGRGARRQDLVAKIAGGARMFPSYGNGGAGIGAENIRSVKDLLGREQVPLAGWDVAGQHGRTVEFHLASGRLVVKALGKAEKQF